MFLARVLHDETRRSCLGSVGIQDDRDAVRVGKVASCNDVPTRCRRRIGNVDREQHGCAGWYWIARYPRKRLTSSVEVKGERAGASRTRTVERIEPCIRDIDEVWVR